MMMHSYIDTAKSLPETLKFYRRDVITMANRINLNGTSFHGAGAITEIVNEAQAHGFQKAFVCSDPDLVKFNVTSKVTDLLEMYCRSSVYMTVKWVLGKKMAAPEGLAELMVEAMPVKLKELFEKLDMVR